MNQSPSFSSRSYTSPWKRVALASAASMLCLGSYSPLPAVSAPPLQISQAQGWDTAVQVARLVNANQDVTALIMQLEGFNKPATSYANAVYQLNARKNGRWVQLYTSTGARLISKAPGQFALAPEVISVSDLRNQLQRLGLSTDLSTLDLQSVVQLRYNLPGQSEQITKLERSLVYNTIAQTTTTQLVSTRTTTTQNQSQNVQVVQTANNTQSINRGNFSLYVVQQQPTLPYVIARVSLRAKRSQGYLRERFVGDYRYKIKDKGKGKKYKKAKFIRGLNPGDIVTVRLFDHRNVFIGYSQFELLSENCVVNLVLNNDSNRSIVRTVYGVDANQDDTIDRGTQVYDYFTQVTQTNSQSYTNSLVTFLTNSQGINLSSFNIPGLPAPSSNFIYPNVFQAGAFSIVSQTIRVFSSNLGPALIARPGQLVQIIDISSSNNAIYEVSQQIINYSKVGVTQGSTNNRDDDDDDDDDDDKKGRSRRNCNQGIGNGSEGCDPGNSSPRGGSNDEGGRKPGGSKK